MPGSTWAQKVQLGVETTAGTAVAATSIWRGIGGHLKDERDTVVVPELIGVAAPSVRSYNPKVGATLVMAATPFTPELGLTIFEAGIKGGVTATEDGTGGSGYMRAYPLGTTTANSLKTYTLESGDNNQAEEAAYCFVEQFTLAAEAGGVVTIAANWRGREVSNTTFTGALSLVEVSHLLASNGELYIDEPGGSFGTTAIGAGNLLSWQLQVNTGWKGKWTADSGALYFQYAYFDKEAFSARLQMKWEHDSAVVTEKGKYRTNVARLIRIDVMGDSYATPGTTPVMGTGQKGLRIDFPGTYVEFDALAGENGNSVVTCALEGGYEAVNGDVLEIVTSNESATVP